MPIINALWPLILSFLQTEAEKYGPQIAEDVERIGHTVLSIVAGAFTESEKSVLWAEVKLSFENEWEVIKMNGQEITGDLPKIAEHVLGAEIASELNVG